MQGRAGGVGISGNRLLYVLLLLISLVAVVAIIVAAVSLSNSTSSARSISVCSGGVDRSSGSHSNPILINNEGRSSANADRGRIWRIAVGHDYGAYSYADEKGYLRGFLKDLIYAVCEYGGMDCRLIWDDYSNCWDSRPGHRGLGGIGLFNNWYDACAGYLATVTRIEVMDFSLPFLKPPQSSFFVKNGEAFDTKDITGKRIGFISGWAADEECLARQDALEGNILPTEDIVYFPTMDQAIAAVNNGSVDALFALDTQAARARALKEIPTEYICPVSGASMMATKDNTFNNFWNAAFQKYRDSGKFSKLCKESQEAHKLKGVLSSCVDAP